MEIDQRGCRHGGDPVFEFGGVRVGGASEGGHGVSCDLLVDLTAARLGHSPPRGFRRPWGSLNKHFPRQPETLHVPWPDMCPPTAPAAFFKEVVTASKSGSHVVFACEGGHGRTGTTLASLLIQLRDMTAYEAIAQVRDEYCGGAVETRGQAAWLCELAGKGETVAQPAARGGALRELPGQDWAWYSLEGGLLGVDRRVAGVWQTAVYPADEIDQHLLDGATALSRVEYIKARRRCEEGT